MKDRIKELRKSLNLTQQAFADRIGTKRNNVTGYESGTRSPSEAVITLICREFRVSEEWLRTGNGDMFLPEASDEINELVKRYNLSAGVQILLDRFISLDKNVQDAVIKFIVDTASVITNTALTIPEEQTYLLDDLFDEEPDEEEEQQVEEYRRFLRAKKKAKAKSSGSGIS